MQAAPGDPRSEVLGFASTGGDPRQDGRGVDALREDCGTLDDLATGGRAERTERAADRPPSLVPFGSADRKTYGSESSCVCGFR